jgi:hypothetical protein
MGEGIVTGALAYCRRPQAKADIEVVLLVLALKVVLLGFGWATTQVLADKSLTVNQLFAIWNRWDAPHYLFLAEHGYQSTGEQRWFLAFFPLFPWLVRALRPVCGTYLAAALVLSTALSLTLAVLLRRLAEREEAGLGASTVWFLFVFPTAYFLHIGYTESLFLALAVGAFLSARNGEWQTAGMLGALAGLTRINALVLLPALACEAWVDYRKDRRWNWRWLWLGLTLVGVAGYLWLNQSVGGHPLRFVEYQREHWFRSLAWPWTGMRESWRAMRWRSPTEAQMVGFQELAFVLIGLVATVVSWFRLRTSWAVWMTGNWLLFASQPFVFGVPRFTLTLFPLFFLLARAAENRLLAAVLTFVSLLFLSLFTSQFVQGRWAF